MKVYITFIKAAGEEPCYYGLAFTEEGALLMRKQSGADQTGWICREIPDAEIAKLFEVTCGTCDGSGRVPFGDGTRNTRGCDDCDGSGEAKRMNTREELAAYAHTAWSGWIRYMFSKAERTEDGRILIPKDSVARWDRQMVTDYADLPESEKESDRKEADAMLEIMEAKL